MRTPGTKTREVGSLKVRVVLRRLPAPARIWGFRIPDSRFRIPGSFLFGNPESRIGNPDWVAAEGRVRMSTLELLGLTCIPCATRSIPPIVKSFRLRSVIVLVLGWAWAGGPLAGASPPSDGPASRSLRSEDGSETLVQRKGSARAGPIAIRLRRKSGSPALGSARSDGFGPIGPGRQRWVHGCGHAL